MASNNPSDKRAERHLRVEAGPAQWHEFDEAQQQAYMRVARMIAEAIGDMPPADQPAGESEAIRRTRSAFVIGGRGTGKTTVLDTFRRDSRPATRLGAEVVRERPELDEVTRARHAATAQERQTLLQQIRGRVVWLETLDMEPLPPETNLLASILVRLEDAARGYGVDSAPAARRPRGLIEPSSEYHGALLELQRLQTEVALAWDGNLKQRQGSLDPDAYAVEVMRVEKARLSLNAKFAETLRKLAAYVFQSRDVQDPLFILPVDDFDLNPPICLDLLRVLRLISIPRLFTIVLGDLHVASTVLSLKLSNDLGSIVSRLQFPMLAVLPSTVASLAGDVAANAIRKLLPPGQRIELLPMLLRESMNFRPLGASDQDLYLHELFANCPAYPGWNLPHVPGVAATPLETDPGVSSLRQLLLAPALSAEAEPNKRPGGNRPAQRALPREVADAAIYSGARFVQAPPRRVADTWLELYKINSDESAGIGNIRFDWLLTFFAEACRAALRETPIFAAEERDDVERAVSRTVAGNWTLRALPLSFRTETTPLRPVELPATGTRRVRPTEKTSPPASSPGAIALPAVHVHTAESLGWQMELDELRQGGLGTLPPGVSRSAWDERRPRRLLSESAVTALIMYHDLLAFAPPGGHPFVTPLLTSSNVTIDWASTEWKTLRPILFRWPAPPCTTFFDYDRFKGAWNEVIKDEDVVQPTGPELVVERLAFAWLSIGTAVVTRESPVVVSSWGNLPWSELVNKLASMAGKLQDHHFADVNRYTEWLRRIAELLMPEMGWPSRVVDHFTDVAPALTNVWRNHRLTIQQRRAERLKQFLEILPAIPPSLLDSRLGTDYTPTADMLDVAPTSPPPPAS